MPRVNGSWFSSEKNDSGWPSGREVVLGGEKFKLITEWDGSRQCGEESLDIKKGGRK